MFDLDEEWAKASKRIDDHNRHDEYAIELINVCDCHTSSEAALARAVEEIKRLRKICKEVSFVCREAIMRAGET